MDTRTLFARIQDGDERAEYELFDKYFPRLVGLARARLSEKLAQKVDADDVVQSALRSFFVRAENGQFAIRRAGELWKLLAQITHTKVLKQAEHFRQQKRDVNQERATGDADRLVSERPDTPVSPLEAVELADEVELLMRSLDDPDRIILEMRLSGQAIPAIAAKIQRSERTVRRSLKMARAMLEQRLQAML